MIQSVAVGQRPRGIATTARAAMASMALVLRASRSTFFLTELTSVGHEFPRKNLHS